MSRTRKEGVHLYVCALSLSRPYVVLLTYYFYSYYSCFISCSPQVAPYAHLLQSCYRSNASTLLYPYSFEPFAIVRHQKSALLCGMYSFTLVVCLGFTTAPIIGMRLLVSIPFYGFNNIFVRLIFCRCPDLYAHPS